MSIKQAANYIRSQGRNNDTQLMHVTPSEVDALQTIARAKGGSLTINPSTGLPEAGFLEDYLPTIAGIAVGTMTANPFLGAAVAGVGSYATTGSLQKGLMSGLGAFGGASMIGSIGAAGAAAANTAPSVAATAAEMGVGPVATGAGSQAAMLAEQSAGFGAEGLANIGSSASYLPSYSAPSAFNPAIMSQNLANVGNGFSQLASDPSGTFAQMGGMAGQGRNMAMVGAPLLTGAFGNDDSSDTSTDSNTTIRPSAYNPETQTYTPLAPVQYEDWGDKSFESYRKSQGYAEGGDVVEQRYQQPTRTVDPSVTEYNNMLMQQANQQYVQGKPIVPTTTATTQPQTTTATTAPVNTTRELLFDPTVQKYIKNPNYVVPVAPARSTTIGDFGRGGYDPWSMGNQADGPAGNDGPPGEGDSPGDSTDGGVGDANLASGGQIKRMASGGITNIAKFQAGGDMSSEAFVVPADVVSALGNGSTDAGMRALNSYLGRASQIEGAGDGLSDDVPATIEGEQPAQVADGEAYIDPQTVAGLGGGDAEKGAAKLYAMMDQIRKAAHGKTSQQKEVNPRKVMPT
jgi:hypothetical protein